MATANEIARFWTKVKKLPSGCWEWTACRYRSGHGQTWWNGRLSRAHRLSWEIHRGPIPAGLNVLHHCDNPPCVNPDHLFLGTQKDNVQDAIRKGRASHIGLAIRWEYFRSRKTCPRGHRYTPKNTYVNPGTGKRDCIRCRKARKRNWDIANRDRVNSLRRQKYAQSH